MGSWKTADNVHEGISNYIKISLQDPKFEDQI